MTVVTDQKQNHSTPPPTAPTHPLANLQTCTPAHLQTCTLAAALLILLLAGLWIGREPVGALAALLRDQEAVSQAVLRFGAWGPLALALAQFLQVLIAFIPGHVFLVAAGYVYGFAGGFVLNLACIVLASQMVYLLTRRAGRPLVNRLANPATVARWETIAERHGFTFFTLAFLLPVIPSDAMNFVAGLSGINARRFFAANLLGRLPSAVILTLIGSHGLELPPSAWAALGAANAILFLIGRYAVNQLQAERRDEAQAGSR